MPSATATKKASTTKTASKATPKATSPGVSTPAKITKANLMDASRVKSDDIIKVEYYTKVIGTGKTQSGEHVVKLQDMYDATNAFAIQGKALIDTCLSADQFNSEVELPMTELAKLFVQSASKRIPIKGAFFKEEGKGPFRVFRGLLHESDEYYCGTLSYEDYDVTAAHRMRQVYLRSLQFFILQNVRYVLKGAKRSTWVLEDGTVVQ